MECILDELMSIGVTLTAHVLITLTALICFDFKLPRWQVMLISVGGNLLLRPLMPWIDGLAPAFLPYIFVDFLLIYPFAKGSLPGKLYCFHMQNSIFFFLPIGASFIAEAIAGYRSRGYYALGLPLLIGLYLLFALFIWKKGKKLCGTLLEYIDQPIWGLFSLLPYVSLIILKTYYDPEPMFPLPMEPSVSYVALPFFIMGALLTLTASLAITQRRIGEQSELRQAQSLLSAGHEYYDRLTSLTEEIHALRHDYRFHLRALQRLMESGEKDSVRKYLDTLDMQLGKTEIIEYSGVRIVDALLTVFAERCAAEKIDFSVTIESMGSLDEYALSIILGNMLENALTACRRTPPENAKYISLIMREYPDQFGMMVKNSFDGKVKKVAGGLASLKPEGGGVGISSIQAVARRHGGEYHADWDAESYRAYIVLHPAKA